MFLYLLINKISLTYQLLLGYALRNLINKIEFLFNSRNNNIFKNVSNIKVELMQVRKLSILKRKHPKLNN